MEIKWSPLVADLLRENFLVMYISAKKPKKNKLMLLGQFIQLLGIKTTCLILITFILNKLLIKNSPKELLHDKTVNNSDSILDLSLSISEQTIICSCICIMIWD